METKCNVHTSRSDSGLLSGSIVEDCTVAEDLEITLAIVGDGGFDLTALTSRLKLDIKGSVGARGSRGSSSQRGKSGNASKELHVEL